MFDELDALFIVDLFEKWLDARDQIRFDVSKTPPSKRATQADEIEKLKQQIINLLSGDAA